MLKLIGTSAIPSINGINIKEIGSKLNCIQIITSEKSTKKSLKAEAMSIIKKEAYEKLLQISEPDNKVDIYFKDGKEELHNSNGERRKEPNSADCLLRHIHNLNHCRYISESGIKEGLYKTREKSLKLSPSFYPYSEGIFVYLHTVQTNILFKLTKP